MASPTSSSTSESSSPTRSDAGAAGEDRRAPIGLWLAFGLTAATSFALALARYDSVHQRTYDLAMYARMAWGFMHGDFWSPVVGGTALGAHVSLVLFPLAALGALLGQVPTLLLAQSLAFAAGVFPMARIARRRLGEGQGHVGALAWLLYPNLWHVTTYEFHPSTLAVLPLGWAADALDRRDPRALLGWGAAAVACREDIGLPVLLFGLSMVIATRSRRGLGSLAVGAAALGLGGLLVWLLGGASGASLDQHFGAWGGSPLGIATALFTDPARVFAHLLEMRTLLYVPMVLAPLLLLPAAAPLLLLPAAGTLALNVISTFPTTTHFYSHYLTPAVPALVSAGLVGLSQLPVRLRHGGRVLLLSLGVSHYAAGGSPLSRDFDAGAYRDDARTEASRAVLSAIPAGASAQAPEPLLPHLAERHDVRRGPPPETGAEWVVLDLRHRLRVAHTETLLRMSEEPLARRWTARDDHRPEVFAPPWLLLSKRPFSPDAPAVRSYYREDGPREEGVKLCACLSLERARVVDDQLELELRAEGRCPADLAVRLGSREHGRRVDLLFDGVLSPAHLRAGDRLLSRHGDFDGATLQAFAQRGLWIGVLRRSGSRPAPEDPKRVHVPVGRGKKATP